MRNSHRPRFDLLLSPTARFCTTWMTSQSTRRSPQQCFYGRRAWRCWRCGGSSPSGPVAEWEGGSYAGKEDRMLCEKPRRMTFAVTCFILLALLVVPGTALAQQRLSLADLDQRLTTVEQKPTPEQIGMLRWFAARTGIGFQVGLGPAGLAFDGSHIWVAILGEGKVAKLRASDGFVEGTFAAGDSPWMLAFDGASIWVTDYYNSIVTKLRASDGAPQG